MDPRASVEVQKGILQSPAMYSVTVHIRAEFLPKARLQPDKKRPYPSLTHPSGCHSFAYPTLQAKLCHCTAICLTHSSAWKSASPIVTKNKYSSMGLRHEGVHCEKITLGSFKRKPLSRGDLNLAAKVSNREPPIVGRKCPECPQMVKCCRILLLVGNIVLAEVHIGIETRHRSKTEYPTPVRSANLQSNFAMYPFGTRFRDGDHLKSTECNLLPHPGSPFGTCQVKCLPKGLHKISTSDATINPRLLGFILVRASTRPKTWLG